MSRLEVHSKAEQRRIAAEAHQELFRSRMARNSKNWKGVWRFLKYPTLAFAGITLLLLTLGLYQLATETPEEAAARRSKYAAEQKDIETKYAAEQKAYEVAHHDEIMAKRHAAWKENEIQKLARLVNHLCDSQPEGCPDHVSASDPVTHRNLREIVENTELGNPDQWKSYRGE